MHHGSLCSYIFYISIEMISTKYSYKCNSNHYFQRSHVMVAVLGNARKTTVWFRYNGHGAANH